MQRFAHVLGLLLKYGTLGLFAAVLFAVVWFVRSGHLSINLGIKLGKPKAQPRPAASSRHDEGDPRATGRGRPRMQARDDGTNADTRR